ncbi:histidine phosphatase family protein [Bacillus sp. OK048]|uniref:histidine phosphatase family protein n=1 Tax=Bacillus sp. OK048 TaxID=1882761 RepID=UPI000889CF45|nr:histidine phosphatase family protein [Bacillus sp. OK048]SDN95876.1 Broad specificity phosphatase PhoE [Bacillus sp. OK048]
MEISLIRHGKSQLTENDKISGWEFKKWVEKYDYNGVIDESTYPLATLEKVATANIVFTSDLKRAVESARLLNPVTNIISDPLFRETELPSNSSQLFNVKLNPSIWAIVLRILWFSGYSTNCESLKQAKFRANKASQQLIDYANEYKSVVLVGHGFFNMLIAKELQKKGWKGSRKRDAKHWNCMTFSLLK